MASSKKNNKNNEENPQQSFDLDAPVEEPVPQEVEPEPQAIEPEPQAIEPKPQAIELNPNTDSETPDTIDVDLDVEPIPGSDAEEGNGDSTPSLDDELTNKETREIVTPYAFTVSPDLLGQALASPSRRGVAILIDLFFISVLTTLSSLVFAGFVAVTFFKAGDRLKQQKKLK